MANERKVFVELDPEDDRVWVGLDAGRKSLVLPLTADEGEQLLVLLTDWKGYLDLHSDEARHG